MKRKRASRNLYKMDRRDFIKTATVATGAALATSISGPFVLRAGASRSEIRIGHLTSFSGPYVVLGKRIDKGLRLAFSLSKYKDDVKFFPEDSQAKPEVSVQKALKLYQKTKIDVLVGPIAGHASLAVSTALRPLKKLLLGAHGGNKWLAGKNCSPYTFLIGHTMYNVSAPIAPWFLKNVGDKVFLVGVDYATGRDIALHFREAFEEIGGQVVGEGYAPLGTTEYAPYLTQVRNAKPKPDGCFGMYAGADAVNWVRQFVDFGLKQDGYMYVGGLGVFQTALLDAMGDACLGFWDCMHTVPYIDNPQNNIFMEAWGKAYPGELIEENGMLGFDVGTAIIEALDVVGGDAKNTEGLAKALHTIEYDSPRGHIKMADNNCTIVPIYARKVVKKDGKYRHEATLLGHFGTPHGPAYEWGDCKITYG